MPGMHNPLRQFAMALLPVAVLLSSCASVPDAPSAASMHHAQVQSEIREVGNRVANWQLANLDNLEGTIRSISRETPNPRGWVKGTFFLGLADYARWTDQPLYLQSLTTIADAQNWRLGNRLYHADDHLVGQFYFELSRAGVTSADLAPTRATLDAILADRPTNQMLHPDVEGDPECSQRWCWSDALFMAPATWWDAAATFGNEDYAAFAHEEFVITTELLFDEDEALYYRDSRFFDRRGADGEKLFWSRGNGWVYGGLVNVLRVMDEADPRREYYVSLFRRMSDRLVEIQADNGMWRASLLATSSTPPETSGTGFFTYGLAWGLNEGLLEGEPYEQAVDAGWEALVTHVDADGRLGYVQQVGDRPEGVRPDDTQLYGVGAFLLAAVQVERLRTN